MPKIEITELDLTSPGALNENFDVVYIPGFVDTSVKTKAEQKLEQKGITTTRLAPNVPTLFTSVRAFENACGPSPAKFVTEQKYADLNTVDASGNEIYSFPNDATGLGVMFPANSYDPSYVMAKELLAAGMNVLYERVNPEDTVFETEIKLPATDENGDAITYTTDIVPADDYVASIPVFKKITDTLPPRIFEPYTATAILPLDDKFTRVSIEGEGEDAVTYYLDYYVCTNADTAKSEFDKTFRLLANTDKDSLVLEHKPNGTVLGWIPKADDIIYRLSDTRYYHFAKVAGTPSTTATMPLIYDTKGEFDGSYTVDEACVLPLVTSGVYSYPSDWITHYRTSYHEKAYVNHNINVSGTLGVKVTTLDGAEVECTLAQIASDNTVLRKATTPFTITYMYDALARIFGDKTTEGLCDKGNYSIKYLTAGGYPVFEYNNNALVTAMLDLAENRGDCVAIIDHTNNPYRQTNVDRPGSVYQAVIESDAITSGAGEFGAMFTPWCTFNRTTTDKDADDKILDNSTIQLGGSFAYLGALADSLKTNAPWMAIAGSTRGKVQNLSDNGVTVRIPNGAADYMQPRSSDEYTGVAVNAITDIKPYGNVIWGNRTLKKNDDNLVATSFLNVRNLVSDVKKICYRTARKLTFEQNNDILWVNFKSMIAPTLDKMVSGYGLSGYKFVRDTEHEKANAKATLCAKIYLYPVYPVEDFYVTIVLQDDDEVSVQ